MRLPHSDSCAGVAEGTLHRPHGFESRRTATFPILSRVHVEFGADQMPQILNIMRGKCDARTLLSVLQEKEHFVIIKRRNAEYQHGFVHSSCS
ncbi:hypothetical protein BSZ22_20695 [Bradyrhizobium canariense]|uniref:Uncharacterized protein n=1 Tax=Bradyrhizobium canariense TaxID=255045 RepID=A0A1X3GN42_9BRAD|nr:hypothetical protein BSZ22_20695 [Bradyrhizobium canariense]OSI78037.1 hypothetical protein BSZ23_19695 [Bradyrhizobium canariense]OSI89267.1 hypothetical protein BSZ25_21165 [Bradyrhizobium canariense]OSI93749.1 hypothetical protein BSZ24_12395 [Bradyrhizobium canariense]OSJ03066.1 hypothetical protein BSZ16_16590 [Bradyrhizobium canariense]